METSLWPEFEDIEAPPTSLILLKQQAAILGRKTKNLVEAQIESGTCGESFVCDFYLFSSLIDYRFRLLRLVSPIEEFPSEITSNQATFSVLSIEDLEWALSKIFCHEKTIRVINAMIARAKQ